MLKRITHLASLASLLSACTSQAPTPVTIPTPTKLPTPQATTRIPPKLEWTLPAQHQPHTYKSITRTVVHSLSASTTPDDTSEVITELTVTLNQLTDPVTISGYINSSSTIRSIRATVEANRAKLPVLFAGTIQTGQLVLELPDTQIEDQQCISPRFSLLGEVREAIASYSTHLVQNVTWTDSIATLTCSGNRLPTALKSVRSYQLIGEVDYRHSPALLIKRAEVTRFTGDGTQEQHQVHVEGTGSGSCNIYIGTETGIIEAIESHQEAKIALKSSGRTHEFTQRVDQTIKRSPLIN